MSAWWGRLLEPAEIVPILSLSPCAKVCRRRNLKQKSTVSEVNYRFFSFLKRPLLCIRGKVW